MNKKRKNKKGRTVPGKFITSLYLDQQAKDDLDKIAETENRKPAQLMRIMIMEGIKQRQGITPA